MMPSALIAGFAALGWIASHEYPLRRHWWSGWERVAILAWGLGCEQGGRGDLGTIVCQCDRLFRRRDACSAGEQPTAVALSADGRSDGRLHHVFGVQLADARSFSRGQYDAGLGQCRPIDDL